MTFSKPNTPLLRKINSRHCKQFSLHLLDSYRPVLDIMTYPSIYYYVLLFILSIIFLLPLFSLLANYKICKQMKKVKLKSIQKMKMCESLLFRILSSQHYGKGISFSTYFTDYSPTFQIVAIPKKLCLQKDNLLSSLHVYQISYTSISNVQCFNIHHRFRTSNRTGLWSFTFCLFFFLSSLSIAHIFVGPWSLVLGLFQYVYLCLDFFSQWSLTIFCHICTTPTQVQSQLKAQFNLT